MIVGKTLTEIQISSDCKALRFKTTDGDVVALIAADCCSETCLDSVEIQGKGLPCSVLSVEYLDMPSCCMIATDKGDVVIRYRNKCCGEDLAWEMPDSVLTQQKQWERIDDV